MNLTNEQVEQIREYVTGSESIRDALQKEAEALRESLNGLQKQASLAPEHVSAALPAERVTATADSMVKAGFIKTAERDALIQQVTADPAFLLDCLDKLAEREIGRDLPSIGKPAAVEVPVLQKTAGNTKSDKQWEEGFQRLRQHLGQ